MITSAAPPNSRPGRMSMARRREAQIAYQGGAPQPARAQSGDDFGLALRAKGVDSPYGPTLLLTDPEEGEPAAPMFLLSAGLFRRLLSVARAMGPPRPGAGRNRSRVDITV